MEAPKGIQIYRYYAMFAVTTVAYMLVQDQIRPALAAPSPAVAYLLGVLPNFLPGIGLPALFYAMSPELIRRPLGARVRQGLALGVGMTGLIAWEFVQQWSPRGVFDWHDVVWTLLGGAVIAGLFARWG